MDPAPIVYVVDDDAALRASLLWMLASHDLRVQAFESATQFLASYRPGQPACLVLDVNLPDMSGLELLERIGSDRAALPVIVISGCGDGAVAQRALDAGACGFFEKPCDGQALLALVRRCLPVARGGR